MTNKNGAIEYVTYYCVFHKADSKFPVAAFKVEAMAERWVEESAFPENYSFARRRLQFPKR